MLVLLSFLISRLIIRSGLRISHSKVFSSGHLKYRLDLRASCCKKRKIRIVTLHELMTAVYKIVFKTYIEFRDDCLGLSFPLKKAKVRNAKIFSRNAKENFVKTMSFIAVTINSSK